MSEDVVVALIDKTKKGSLVWDKAGLGRHQWWYTEYKGLRFVLEFPRPGVLKVRGIGNYGASDERRPFRRLPYTQGVTDLLDVVDDSVPQPSHWTEAEALDEVRKILTAS